ncbi:hypothetical protein [Pseudodesulfovibrio karagichevae]|uniref:Uncharacterized protein n=1 Tax=Pseudodesulfovibrio karagichevae TaxID=3239305 RepID=A0ABV4K5S5_9BACT
MRLAVIIRAEQKDLPTAAELREAGFAVSTALGPGRDVGAPGGAPCDPCDDKPDSPGPERAGPTCRRLPERQRP